MLYFFCVWTKCKWDKDIIHSHRNIRKYKGFFFPFPVNKNDLCTLQCLQVSLEMYSPALCFSFWGDEGYPALLANPAPEAERQTQLCLYDFGFLCFRDYVEGPERRVSEGLQVLLLLLWHHWRQNQPSAGHKLQVKLNNPTHPICQHLLSLSLWWKGFQDANPKVRSPEPCTHPPPFLCGLTKEASVLLPKGCYPLLSSSKAQHRLWE